MGWQVKMMKEQMCASCQTSVKSPRDYAKQAADVGTICHAAIEAHIKHGEFPGEIDPRALKGFDNYLQWLSMVHFEPLTMETPLVSERYQFGTTIDIMGLVVGKRSIVEIKTSNDLYSEYLIQVAAQKVVWEEVHPDQPIESISILKVGKESASFNHYWISPDNLEPAFEAFKDLRNLHEKKKILSKLI